MAGGDAAGGDAGGTAGGVAGGVGPGITLVVNPWGIMPQMLDPAFGSGLNLLSTLQVALSTGIHSPPMRGAGTEQAVFVMVSLPIGRHVPSVLTGS